MMEETGPCRHMGYRQELVMHVTKCRGGWQALAQALQAYDM